MLVIQIVRDFWPLLKVNNITWTTGTKDINKEMHKSFSIWDMHLPNVVERCFGLLKIWWAILSSPLFYSIRLHNRAIITYCLLYNLLGERCVDSMVDLVNEVDEDIHNIDIDYIIEIQNFNAWTHWSGQLTDDMFSK